MNPNNIRPLKDNVLVRLMKQEAKTKGGLFLPEASREQADHVEVMSIGDKVENVKVGDIVMVERYTGQNITIEQDTYLITREQHITAVFEKDDFR